MKLFTCLSLISAMLLGPAIHPAFAEPTQAEVLAALRPAEGLWYEAGRPGTGFNFQRRGQTIVVTQYDFKDGRQVWRLGSGLLGSDVLNVELSEFTGGSCFGCLPHANAQPLPNPVTARITFQSARRAWVELPNNVRRPLTSAPFGVEYLDFLLRDELDQEFGRLLLPKLSGRWSFRDSEIESDEVVSFGQPSLHTGSVSFHETSIRQGLRFYKLLCTDARPGRPAGCSLEQDFGVPGENPGVPSIGFAELGDVEETRIRFRGADGRVFYATRESLAP